MSTRTALAVVLLAACSKSDPPPSVGSGADPMANVPAKLEGHHKHADKPAGTPRPQPQLTVTLDGKPVTIQAALVARSWNGELSVTLSSRPLSCEEVTSDMREIKEDEVSFGLSIANGLKPDGTLGLQLRSLEFGGMNTVSNTAPAAGSGDGTPGQSTTIAVDYTMQDLKKPPRTLVVKGTIDALGCTPATHGDAPALPPEMPATLTIAGKTLPIRGAFLERSSSSAELKLTTGREGCKQVPYETPGDLEVQLAFFKLGEPAPGQINLGGALLGNAGGDQMFDKKKITVTPVPLAPGELTLAADITVSGYPVKLAGKVTAVECPK